MLREGAYCSLLPFIPPALPSPAPTHSEAVLALEAECQRNPSNAEAWRLLGTVQAENDDDQQAIAAMNRWGPRRAGCRPALPPQRQIAASAPGMNGPEQHSEGPPAQLPSQPAWHASQPPCPRALAADPSDLDVLLSLGVSHTNELEQVGGGVIQEQPWTWLWVGRDATTAGNALVPGPCVCGQPTLSACRC